MRYRGIIEALSDFWLLYFKDIDQLQVLYEGTDVLMGQLYLDMLSQLLNNSLQDAPLFSRESVKQVRIKETELKYLQRRNISQSRFVYVAEDNIVSVRALQNKVLNVTATLERDIDFFVTEQRTFEFVHDPLNAYLSADVGLGLSRFSVRTREPRRRAMSLSLRDDGSELPVVTSSATGDSVEVFYDGPGHTAVGTSRQIVSLLNTDPIVSGLVFAELATEDGGTASPHGTSEPIVLRKQPVQPLDGYAIRHLEQLFGARFLAQRLGDWVALGVEKGDILRLRPGAQIGTAHEFPISLVRRDALYLLPGEKLTAISAASQVDFAILRQPEDNQVVNEPFGVIGRVAQQGIDGKLESAERHFYADSAAFSALHQDDVIEFLGAQNTGYARILEVIDAHTVALAATNLRQEDALTWRFYSPLRAEGNDGALTPVGSRQALFSTSTDVFTTATAGTLVRVVVEGKVHHFEIVAKNSPREVRISGVPWTTPLTGLLWGWAAEKPAAYTAVFPFMQKGTVRVQAQRLLDNAEVLEGRDYVVYEDLARIEPLTVWRTQLEPRVDYSYRYLIASASSPIATGSDAQVTAGTPAVFHAESAEFGYYDLGQRIEIVGHGQFTISKVRSATEVELAPDPRLSVFTHPNAQYLWRLYPRGVLETDDIRTFIYEISFWATDAEVDRNNLYTNYGYLIGRFQASSESYRSFIRGVFQLFMLGPTLERLESAVNIVAGMPVVRDDGEILLDYDAGATQTGGDGYLDSKMQTFKSVSARFDDTAMASQLYIGTGLNENRVYRILSVLSPHEILVEGLTSDDGPVQWELSEHVEQTVTTSRRTYRFPRTVPLRATVTNPANIGVKIFRAFEVLTEVFQVTDYIESPTWWERVQIPEELWPNASVAQRQSTPALVEHVVGPQDGASIGDPGYRIGSDHTGFVPASGAALSMRHHIAFVVLDSILKYHLFYVSFNPVLLGRLSTDLIRDLEEFVFIAKPSYTYIVLSPSSLFKEVIQIREGLNYKAKLQLDAAGGDAIKLQDTPLRIGDDFRIGEWFRYTTVTGTFPAPVNPTGTVILTSEPESDFIFSKVVLTDFTAGGQPIPMALRTPTGIRQQVRVVDNALVFDIPDVAQDQSTVSFVAYGLSEPSTIDPEAFDPSEGDTAYFIGMNRPRLSNPEADMVMYEYPIQIRRRLIA